MKMKKWLMFIFVLAFGLLLVACNSSSSDDASSSDSSSDSSNGNQSEQKNEENSGDEEEITLKMATYFASTSPIAYTFTEPFMEKVTERTNGKVQFEYFPAEQLGKAADLLNLTRDKVTDISVFPPVYVSNQMPITGTITFLPGTINASYEGTMALTELLQENETVLEYDYKPNGVVPITGVVSPPDEFWTVGKEIRVPADLKGMKVRSNGAVMNQYLEFIGATPVTISFPEIYESMERGVLDILLLYSMGLKNGGIHELVNYAIMPHIGSSSHTMAINEDVWNSLPEDVQQIMLEVGREIAEDIGNVYVDETIEFDQAFVDAGNTIAELTEDEMAEWKKVADEFNAKWLEENGGGDVPIVEVFEAYKEKVQKYR